jgi:hypothetical protein
MLLAHDAISEIIPRKKSAPIPHAAIAPIWIGVSAEVE